MIISYLYEKSSNFFLKKDEFSGCSSQKMCHNMLMSGKTAKRIRKKAGLNDQPESPVLRRIYRRLKKQYNKLPSPQKANFFKV